MEFNKQFQVIAATEIPSRSHSAAFSLNSVTVKVDLRKLLSIQVGYCSQKQEIVMLCPELSSTKVATNFWPKYIPFAPDCHSQNLIISRFDQKSLILQAIRNIEVGQQLFLWFDEELLVNYLQIPPYLSPGSIKGGNSYVCDKCGQEYEAPNYLKIHLSLNCGRNSIETLWLRLIKMHPTQTSSVQSSFRPFLIHSQQLQIPLSLLPKSNSTSMQLDAKNNNSVHRISPVLTTTAHQSFVQALFQRSLRSVASPSASSSSTTTTTTSVPNMQEMLTQPPSRSLRNTISHKGIDSQQAHLESIMSNMGKGKNGHVCLYCGKLYSRKYGLKIHIRTHTGYKPLACKICHRPFGDPSNLNKHVRLHSEGTTPYRCEICGKVLVRRRDLDRHIQSRHAGVVSSCHQSGQRQQ